MDTIDVEHSISKERWCYVCGSTTTWRRKRDGKEVWYKNRGTNLFLCTNCYLWFRIRKENRKCSMCGITTSHTSKGKCQKCNYIFREPTRGSEITKYYRQILTVDEIHLILEDLYIRQGMSMNEIAYLLALPSSMSVKSWMKMIGMKRRSFREAARLTLKRDGHINALKGGKLHHSLVMSKCKEYEALGYRVIPIMGKPLPDAILINGKEVIALEVEINGLTPAVKKRKLTPYVGNKGFDTVMFCTLRTSEEIKP